MEFIHGKNRISVESEDGRTLAEVTFPEVSEGVVNIDHTYVSNELRGQGVAGRLMEELAGDLKESGRKATLTCSYAVGWFEKHPECEDLLAR